MSYPGIQSQRKRDEAASTLRRWRKMRDEARSEAAQHEKFSIALQLCLFTANYWQNHAEGYREALDLLGWA